MSEKLKVLIEVKGGVAEATSVPDGVEVEIIDHDVQQDIEPLHDVLVYHKASKVVESIVGKNLKYDTGTNNALKRLDTIKERINFDYDAAIVPAGQYEKGDRFRDDSGDEQEA
jgi:hypothetical protein